MMPISCRLIRKREDVYRVVKAFATRGEWINAEAKSYVQVLVLKMPVEAPDAERAEKLSEEVRDFERNGLNLTSTKKEEVQHLQAQIDDLSMQYIQNLNDDRTFLLFTDTELEGLPAEFLQMLDRAMDDKIKVPLKSNYVSPILEFCRVCFPPLNCIARLRPKRLCHSFPKLCSHKLENEVGASRRRVAVAYGQRCKEVNVPLLENLVVLRHKLARLLGYDNYAEYAVCSRMAKTTSKVFEFLEDLSTSLSDLAAKELAILQDLKKKEEGDCTFGIEDLLYYVKKFEDEKFNLDFGALKEYFPLSLVLQGIFKVLQDLLGLRFEEILGAVVWHEDVRVFAVFDLSSGELIGYAYLDLYSREGKYGQTCVLPLQNGSLPSNGARQLPVVLMISGFTKEDGNCPVLLQFSEVVNLFHEFGHVAHHLCNHASLVRFSGLRVDPDFVEIPGHMFENWCYDSSILKIISGYYQDITRPIKNEVCSSLRRWRHSFSVLKLRQEILYCKSPAGVYSIPLCAPPRVFAADVFASKFCDGLLNHHIGMQFRNKVLAPGGARDPLESLSNFMGRQPSIQAFVDSRASSGV
ncbi:hypothetical protein Cgig2_024677 [Carnegiea gigantea]|uniref:Peptidase M3A/M3B catalytic domain-containing protein n=1 Tax=Carnegiea gigantea TaxID=171969 RepID=A0A9Q1K915_9CARY|nr:hypothetical protein Cgig2_024677 [Carnegiea gigantea]